MFDKLRDNINNRVRISDEEFDVCTKYFTRRIIKKHQFLLNEGDVCIYIGFVNSGCMRQYTLDPKGDEHIIQFAVDDWWVSDLNSFLSGLPSGSNIDALHDSEILLLEKSAREELLNKCPKMERFFRILLEANYIATHQRVIDALSASAEERYLKFIKSYPNLFERIPQHYIASYLGITPQSLSRIRKELSVK